MGGPSIPELVAIRRPPGEELGAAPVRRRAEEGSGAGAGIGLTVLC